MKTYLIIAEKRAKLSDRVTKQLAVPVSLEDDVLRSYHDCLAGAGHNGQDRTYVIMRMKYFWPNMYRDSEEDVKSYIACQ